MLHDRLPRSPTVAAASSASASAAASASASASASDPPSTSSPPPPPPFVVRRATEEDWWHISKVHCASFFPGTPGPLVPLFRLDRVLGIETGMTNEVKGLGRFACLVAVEDEGRGSGEEGEGGEKLDGENAAAPASFPLSLLPRKLRGCFESLEESATRAGVLGAICVDAQGCQLPPRKLPLRRRNPALASFVSLISPNAEPSSPPPSAVLASSSPRTPPPPSGLRAPPGTVAYLSNLAVSPHARKLGVGRALLEAAEREAWAWGCRSVALHVSQRGNAAAARLYLSSGFRAVGGALPLLDPAEEGENDKGASATTQQQKQQQRQQQLTGAPLTLMLKVAPREVVARRAREAAEARAEAEAKTASSSPSSFIH